MPSLNSMSSLHNWLSYIWWLGISCPSFICCLPFIWCLPYITGLLTIWWLRIWCLPFICCLPLIWCLPYTTGFPAFNAIPSFVVFPSFDAFHNKFFLQFVDCMQLMPSGIWYLLIDILSHLLSSQICCLWYSICLHWDSKEMLLLWRVISCVRILNILNDFLKKKNKKNYGAHK